MLSIYTYPNNSGTGYIDPDYYGSTTPAGETGYYKRILELKNGAYKPWVTGQTAPVDSVSDLITATGKFHKGVSTENGLENIQIYSYYNQPLITIDSIAIAENVTLGVPDAVPAARLTVGDTSEFVDGDSVLLTGFNGTLASNNNDSMFIDVINSTTVDLYRDVSLTNPLRYTQSIASQPGTVIDYSTSSTSVALYDQPLQITLTGLGAGHDGAGIEFATGSGNDWQERLFNMTGYWSTDPGFYIKHNTGNVFDLYFNYVPTSGNAQPVRKLNYIGDGNALNPNLDFLRITGVKPDHTNTGTFKFDPNPSGHDMWGIQRLNSITNDWVTELKGSPFGLQGTNASGYILPDATGDTGVSMNTNYLYTKEQNAFLNGNGIGHGYYVEPIYDDTGTVQINDKRGDHVNWTPKAVYVNYDGLSHEDGGQDIQNTGTYPATLMQNRWFKGGASETVPYTNSFIQDSTPVDWTKPGGDLWKVSQSGIDYPAYTNASESTREDWFDAEIIWSDPTDANNTEVDYIEFRWFNLAASPTITDPNLPYNSTSNIYQYMSDKLASNPAFGQWTDIGEMKYVDLVLDGSDVSYPMILQAESVAYGYHQNTPSWGLNEWRLRCYAWSVDSAKKENTTTKLNLSGAKQGVTNTQNTFTPAVITYTPYLLTNYFLGEVTTPSNYAFYSNLENINFDATPLPSTYTWNAQGMTSLNGITVPSTFPYYDEMRTGTHLKAFGGSSPNLQNRLLKLVSQTSTTKTFTFHAGPTNNPYTAESTINWGTATNISYTQLASVSIDGGNFFTRNTNQSNFEYWEPLTTATEFYDGAEYKYVKLEAKSTNFTSVIGGVNIADSTTGNIALNGTYAFKASNPHIYFPGNQTYQQRTGESTYVNGAIVGDEYYDENSGTASNFTNGSGAVKPTITISQSAEGYIDGITLIDTGRIADAGQKMLKIDTLADTYTPPTPTPAELEDVWDTDDEWASDGDTTPEKVWPHHITPMSAVINYNSPTLVNNSQSGIKYTRSVGHTKWRLEVEYPPMSAEDFQKFHAVAQAAHGQSTPFLFKLQNKDGTSILWKDFYDQSNSTTTPRIKSAVTPGDTTILVEGFNSNETDAFKRGEVFIDGENENGNLHTSLSGTDSNVYGEAKIRTPWPFRTAQVAGTQIHKNPEHAIVTFASDNFEYQVDVNNYYFVSVAFDLDSWK